MYLKKIEVQGFKSFANKIIFDFHQGITGIVGPNGSGKSNVSDAVRWVLGEQSAKSLRGGNMQDVIFAGTKLRKPQGYAFVAITLDNSDHALNIDFDEVTVSRRLFRSGESEYMINGSSVRLKDINELFYDTGIGKDGYSIIGQGQVEKILSGRPEERRELFDEAAGITKFKRRKSIAIKKLENEKANLTRVSDILSELEKQVGPLKKQAEVAKEYLKLRDELRVLDSSMFILQENNISNELEEISKKEAILSKDLEISNKESIEINSNFEIIDNEINDLEDLITNLRNAISDNSISLKDFYGKIDVLKEQINTDRVNLEHYSTRKNSIINEISNKKSNILEAQNEKTDISKRLEDNESIKIDLDNKIIEIDKSIKLLLENISSYNEQKLENLNTKSDLAAKLESSKTTIEQLNIRKSELDARLITVQVEDESLKNRILEEENKLAKIKIEEQNRSLTINNIEELLKKYNFQEEQLVSDIEKVKNTYQQAKVKLDTLKNLAERYDGYGLSIKKVMESKARNKGIHGVVADLIKVSKNYELAIEISLGARIQNVVTDNEDTAKVLIEYLKSNKLGRATFLPLSSIEVGAPIKNTNILSEKGVIGIAGDLVDTADIYKKLISNLLSRIIVVDNIDNAIAIAKKYKYEYRLVTLEGDQLSPGGSLSGGAYRNNSNLLGRKREIDDLELSISKDKKILEKLGSDLSNLKAEINTNILLLNNHKEEQLKANLNINTITNSLSIFEERKSKNATDLNSLLNEIEVLDKEVFKNKSSYSDLENSLKLLNELADNKAEYNKDLDSKLENLQKENEEFVAKQKNIELNIASLKARLEHNISNISRLENELANLIEQEKSLISNINFEDNIELKNKSIENINQNIESLKLDILEKENNLKIHIANKEEKSHKHKELFDKKDEILQRISLLDKDIFRLQANKEKLEDRRNSLNSYMWTEYELSLNTCKPFVNKDLVNISELKKDIDKKKSGIRSLGNVNVASIEEYANVSERYEELKTQYDDIILATKQLMSIISELDIGMRKQFKEKFALISEEFNKVFSELFGGGSGKLELDSETDILDASISIISQPPGKKLQNMMQLSGGEKALTAISLLFAIQNLKPSPFALLDEIEAALDDSNVDRFAHYLHKLSDRTQFIVITHRRGTMVNSDRLYGITMQEKGVSTLVSVSLIEDKLAN